MAQLDRTALTQKLDNDIIENNEGDITAVVLNALLKDFIDSQLNLTDETGLLASGIGTSAEAETIIDAGIHTIT